MFTLTDDERAISETARDFAAEFLAPNAVEWDQAKHFPVDVLRKVRATPVSGVLVFLMPLTPALSPCEKTHGERGYQHDTPLSSNPLSPLAGRGPG